MFPIAICLPHPQVLQAAFPSSNAPGVDPEVLQSEYDEAIKVERVLLQVLGHWSLVCRSPLIPHRLLLSC
jgi:hypothetical protein